jgi:nucleotide-binding universal stress UspA family protein
MLPEIKTILYATDLSPRADEVFRYAMSVAHRHDARIVAVHAVEPLNPSARSMVNMYLGKEATDEHRKQVQAQLVEDTRKQLQLFCDEDQCVGPDGQNRVAEIRIIEGRPAQVIFAEVERVGADLIVMGSHGHTAVGEILLGSTAHKVVQHAPVPVLLVRQEGE